MSKTRKTRFQRSLEQYFCENNISSTVPKKEKIKITVSEFNFENRSKITIQESDKHKFFVSSNEKDIVFYDEKGN